MALRPRLCAALLSISLGGCAHTGYRSTHEQCLEAPDSYGNGSSRSGGWSKSLGFSWADRSGSGYVGRDGLKATWSIEDCWHIIRVESDEGSWESNRYGYVDQFRASPDGRRLAFVGSNQKAHVVVDGVESQGWRDILWGPTFSPNSRHVGYLAKDDSAGVAVVDGAVVMRAPDIKRDNFHVFDDGRLAFVSGAGSGRWRVVVGRHESEAFDDVCELSFVTHESGRFAFVGKRGGRYIAVVDGVEHASLGLIASCDIELSPDGAHFAFSTWAGNDQRQPAGVVVDGQLYETPSSPGIAGFVGDRALVSFSSGHEQTAYLWAGVPTPAAAPTKDDYRPATFTHWCYRVQLGESLGPCFDSIDTKSLRQLADGSVSYQGTRGPATLTVIDNVITEPEPPPVKVEPPPPPPPPAPLVPEPAEPPVLVIPE